MRVEIPHRYTKKTISSVYAVVAQCPYFRGDLLHFDGARAKTIPGVLEVFDIPTDPNSANKNTREVVVVATNTWAAIQSRNTLTIKWKPEQYRDESTESLTAQLRAGSTLSQGTLRTAIRQISKPVLCRRGGTIVVLEDRSPHWIDFGLGAEPCVPVSWGDVATALPDLREVLSRRLSR